ncbi:PEPxxWA-CTERM sorting domain-containing protein [Polymorphobacter fuscus]|nr:PEPxxWA-CTERM sorting domain-containing protein [Polymorphobacter fuscus]NJC09317.1 hypothetical protein [Polymorphobacter fuscus]
MKSLYFVALASVALLGSPAFAAGPNLTVEGDTIVAPTFHRPQENGSDAPVMLDDFGMDVAYQATEFTVLASGAYMITMLSEFDNYLGLYAGSFDPSSPLANAQIYNDDLVGRNSGFTTELTLGTSYFVVASGYSDWDKGAYTLSFFGPGEIVLASAGAVPEPAAWAMMIAGFGLVGGTMRQRRTAVA